MPNNERYFQPSDLAGAICGGIRRVALIATKFS
jgi:hypothetical protein